MSLHDAGDKRSRKKKKLRYFHKVKGSMEKPRLVVFKSNKHIYAQLVDDENGKTLLDASTLKSNIKVEVKGKKKVDQAQIVGKILGEKAIEAGIENVRFDRNGYIYHGRIKALADGARAGGLKF